MGKKAKSDTPATTHSTSEADSAFSQANIIFLESTPTLAGASQELLFKMIDAMGVKRDTALITSVQASGTAWPDGKIVVALGELGAQQVIQVSTSLSELRSKVHFMPNGPRVIATYHPSYLLQNPASKKEAWEDLKLAMRELGAKRSS